jgi:hypothetical protein
MRNRSCPATIAIAITLLVAGCASRTPLTQGLIDKYALTGSELKKVQYYLSEAIEIERVATVQDSRVVTAGHTLRSEHGRLLKSILFDRGLPGIALETQTALISVAFEEGASLFFERQSDGRFYIAADWEFEVPDLPQASSHDADDFGDMESSDYTNLPPSRLEPLSGTIEYNGEEYGVRKGRRAYLTVEETSLSKLEKSRRKVEGMRLE